MNHEVEIIKEMKKLGKNPSQITQSEYFALSLKIRTIKQIEEDAKKLIIANINSTLKINIVPKEIGQLNIKQCRKGDCNSYKLLANGIETCIACNCVGKNLENKTEQLNEYCPKINPETGKPYWDNRYIKLTINKG